MNKKDHSATLFLLCNQLIKQKEGSQSVYLEKVVDIDIHNLITE